MKTKLLKLLVVITISITALFALGMTAGAEMAACNIADGDVNITAEGDYSISGSGTDAKITIDCSGVVNIKFDNLSLTCTSYRGTMMEIKNGTVNIELDGENILQAHQDSAIYPCVSISENAELHFYDSDSNGSITIHGTSNYNGGGAAVSGGSLYVHSGSINLVGGNKIQNNYGKSFDGKVLNIEGGSLSFAGGIISSVDNGYISVSESLVIGEGASLTVSNDSTVEIMSTASATINGTVINNGDIVNSGIVNGDGEIIGTPPYNATGSFIVTGGTNGTDYTYADGVLTINTATALTIKNTDTSTATTDKIVVASGVSANITLAEVNIDVSGTNNVAAVSITNGSTANITLVGSNTLTGGYNAPGVFVAKDNTVSFTAASTGSLTASGNNQAPGIGASATAEGGHIIVNGGDITVIAGGYKATNALGSAFANCNKPAQSFTMTGGKVCAVPTKGFSGGNFGDNVATTAVTVSGDIIISGGIFISQFENIQSHGTGIGGKLITTDSGNAVIWAKFGCYNGSAISDTSNKAEWHGLIIEGYTEAKVYGSNVTLPGDFTIETDVDGFGGDVVLEVPEGSTLVIPSGVTLTNNNIINNYGTIIVEGTLTNSGCIKNFGSIVNNNDVTGSGKIYNENGGTTSGNGTYTTTPITIGTDFLITSTNSDYTLVYGTDYTYPAATGVLTILSEKAVTIKNSDPQTPTTDRIEVATGVSANITLAGVNIDASIAAFLIAENSIGNVTITLADGTTNTLKSGPYSAGLQKNGTNGSLTIQGGTAGTGILNATGSNGGAGIGGSSDRPSGNIIINGGIITARSSVNGAGIGGGYNGSYSGDGSNITISGGSVTAIGGPDGGAGIGGGMHGNGSDITISGGSVKAVAGTNANAIGGGNGQSAETPTDGSNDVYLLTIANPESKTVYIDNVEYTPVNHTAADSTDTNLYVYLPAKTVQAPNEVTVGNETTKYTYDTANSKWLVVVDAPEEDCTAFTYNGVEQSYILAKSDYYTITDNRQINAGTHTVTVTLNDGYIWSDGTTAAKEYTFTIAKADISTPISDVEMSFYYDETGEQTATVSGLPVGMGTETPAIQITDANGIIDANSVVYGQGRVRFTLIGFATETSGISATIKVTISTQNYNDFSFNVIVNITEKNVQTVTASDVILTYGDTNGKVTATTDGDGEISYEVATGEDVISVDTNGNITILKAGTATVTVKAAETFDYAEATKTISVTVNKAAVTVTAKSYSIKVGDTLPTYAYDVAGLVNGETLPIDVTISCNAADSNTAGTYTITVSGAANSTNYTFAYVNGTLTISNKLEQTITASDVTLTYGETGKKITATTSGDGAITYSTTSDVISVAADGTITALKAGTATVTINAAETDTYATATKTVTLTVNKAAVTVTAKSYSIKVGEALPTYAYDVAGLVNGETLPIDVTISCTADGKTAGTYDIIVSGAAASDNYTFSYVNGTLTISNKLEQTITASDVILTYGDTDGKITATTDGDGAITYSTTSDVISVAADGTITAHKAGTATVTVKAAETDTYAAATKTITVTVSKAAVTVTAKSYIIKVGDTLPTYAYDVTGLVNGETLPIDVTISCTADGKTAGTYDIVVSGAAASDNYTFSYVKGTLTVNEKEVVATPTFTPASGTTFTSTQNVTIACATEGAKIYYTTDGTAPTTASTLYNGAITINKTTTIKAIAVKDGMTDSAVVTATYTKKSSGGGGGGGYTPSLPSTPNNPEIGGKSASWATIADDISKLPIGSEVTIELNSNYDVPVNVIKAIADRDVKVTFIADSTRSWYVDGAEIETPTAADLSIIYIGSLKADGVRGDVGTKFRIDGTNIPTELKLTVAKKNAGKFANLYKKDGDKLVFVDNAKIDADGNAMLSVSEKGDYVVMICEFSDRKGDVTNDGVTNVLDASAILKDIVGVEKAANPAMLDYNGDGATNVLDASAILIDIVNGII